MLINLSELFPVEGKSKTYDLELEMTQFHAPDGVYGIVEKHPVNLVITNQGDKTKIYISPISSLTLLKRSENLFHYKKGGAAGNVSK